MRPRGRKAPEEVGSLRQLSTRELHLDRERLLESDGFLINATQMAASHEKTTEEDALAPPTTPYDGCENRAARISVRDRAS
jgi:hypothetical protein